MPPGGRTMASDVETALREQWLQMRDDANFDAAAACVRFAHRLELLTAEQEELWLRRLSTCPGHDDEGGRSWCAFCGDMPAGGRNER